MDAPTLRQVFDAVYLLMLGAWGGAAALVLLLLPAESEAQTRRLLARFYALGATCGALALPAAACARLAFPEYRTPWFALQALALVGLILPMIAGAARLSGPNGASRPLAIGPTRARLACLLAALVALAAAQALRPPPRTRGIVEPLPGAAPPSRSPSLPTSAGGTRPGNLH